MNSVKKISLITFLCLILVYITNITGVNTNIILFEGESYNLGTLAGIYEKRSPIIETASSTSSDNIISQENIQLSLFNIIDLKSVSVTTMKNTNVIPLGNTIGLKLYSSGVLVIGMTEIEGTKPYANSGIKEGDLIISVNDKEINTTEELINCVKSCKGKMLELTYIRDGEALKAEIEPAITSNKEYKLRVMGKRRCCRNWYRYLL